MISLPNPSNSPDARALSSAHPLTPMRVTIVTPFSPLQRHDHAADDLASPAFAAIAQLLTLTVITRGTHTSGVRRIEQDGYVIHELPRRNPSLLRRLTGFYPAGLRSDWSPHDTLGTLRLLGQIPTDHVHFEYLQPAEVALRLPAGWSITLHDITTAVFREHFERSQGPEKLYRWLEWRRLERIETLAIRRGNPVFALSDRDVSTVNRFHGRGALLRIGIPQHLRDPGRAPQVPTFVFAGAMGRHANIEAAKYLAHQVMPEVWRLMPDARLRLVGASPSPEVLRLADDQRVAVVGRVESIEDEYRAATAVFAPTVVEAGILLKALRGAACGAPLLLNSSAAAPIGFEPAVHALIADTPEELATAAVQVATRPEEAQAMAMRAFDLVTAQYSWQRYAADFANHISPAREARDDRRS